MKSILALLVLSLLAATLWQHLRYRQIRREIVEDRQPLLYGAETLHAIYFLQAKPGADLFDALRKLRGVLEAAPGAELIYAGKAAFTGESSQLGPRAWDAVLFVQYPSREAYDRAAASETQQAALSGFQDTYVHGMERPRAINLLLPQALLGLRVRAAVRGEWSAPPLEREPAPSTSEVVGELAKRQAELLAQRDTNARALVVFNLITAGTAEQRAADRSYGLKMLTRMAQLSHGPLHIGRAVTLEGDARFDDAVVVYYPGVEYFASLIGSRFFQGIIGDKQLADTQAVPTVPILSKL